MKPEKQAQIVENGLALRDECMAMLSQALRDKDLATLIAVKGATENVLSVLNVLDAIGIPGCRAR